MLQLVYRSLEDADWLASRLRLLQQEAFWCWFLPACRHTSENTTLTYFTTLVVVPPMLLLLLQLGGRGRPDGWGIAG